MEDFELTKFSCYLGKTYGPKLSVHAGKRHNYLGVKMKFNDDGMLDTSMIRYLKNVISEFPEVITGKAATSAADHLFAIRDKKEAHPLEKEQALTFHHSVTQLLFMAMQVRQDIQSAAAILTTRVKTPDEDDWEKLKRVLKYLNGTKYLKLKLSKEDVRLLKWYMDGSHNMHWDCNMHGGVMLTLGKGATTSYLQKVKLNMHSSTKTELVVVDMHMPEMLHQK